MKMDCQHFRDKFEAYLAGMLSRDEKSTMENHLETCPECRQALEREKSLLTLLRSIEHQPAPDVLRQRVMNRLRRESSAKPSIFESIGRFLTLSRVRILTGAAAAVLLIFIGVRIFSPPGRPRVSMPLYNTDESYKPSPDDALSPSSTELSASLPAMGEKAVKAEEFDEPVKSIPHFEAKPLREKDLYGKNGLSLSPLATMEGIQEDKSDLKTETASIEEQLETIGAEQIKKLEEDESGAVQYAFLISQDRFEMFKKISSEKNIRIVKAELLKRDISLSKEQQDTSGWYSDDNLADSAFKRQRNISQTQQTTASRSKMVSERSEVAFAALKKGTVPAKKRTDLIQSETYNLEKPSEKIPEFPDTEPIPTPIPALKQSVREIYSSQEVSPSSSAKIPPSVKAEQDLTMKTKEEPGYIRDRLYTFKDEESLQEFEYRMGTTPTQTPVPTMPMQPVLSLPSEVPVQQDNFVPVDESIMLYVVIVVD
jgi:mycothiol system anti-sigma-R factor